MAQRKNEVTRAQKERKCDRETMRLYKAVAAYVTKRGGSVVLCGGVQVIQWPDSLKYNWTLGIKCTGNKPLFADEPCAAAKRSKR